MLNSLFNSNAQVNHFLVLIFYFISSYGQAKVGLTFLKYINFLVSYFISVVIQIYLNFHFPMLTL